MSATDTSPLSHEEPTAYLEAIRGQFDGDPDEPVLLFGGRWITYGELGATIERCRSTFTEVSAPGATIGIETPNAPFALAGIVGAMLAGRCAMPLSPRRLDAQLETLETELGAVLFRVTDTSGAVADRQFERLATPLGDLSIAILDQDLGGDPQIALMVGTSGTTGEPRHVPILHRTIDLGITALRAGNGSAGRRTDVNITCFPLYHLAGLIPSLLTLASGRRIALLEKFDPLVVARLVDEHAIRSLALTPTTIRMLLDADVSPGTLDSLRYVRSGTAPLPVHTARAFQERFGVPVIQAYGQTETGGEVIGWDPEDVRRHLEDKVGAVGRPRPGIEVRVTSPGQDAPDGALAPQEIGELWLRGVQGDRTWHRSGDLASEDEDGFVWIHGRADDVIVCGGFNIHPALLEHVLERHEAVRDAAVAGVPDDRLGSVPVAVVVTRSAVSDQELDAWCRDHLEPYQCPRRYVRADALPRTDTGKVHRPGLDALIRA